jgi:hypothetical protein
MGADIVHGKAVFLQQLCRKLNGGGDGFRRKAPLRVNDAQLNSDCAIIGGIDGGVFGEPPHLGPRPIGVYPSGRRVALRRPAVIGGLFVRHGVMHKRRSSQ